MGGMVRLRVSLRFEDMGKPELARDLAIDERTLEEALITRRLIFSADLGERFSQIELMERVSRRRALAAHIAGMLAQTVNMMLEKLEQESKP